MRKLSVGLSVCLSVCLVCPSVYLSAPLTPLPPPPPVPCAMCYVPYATCYYSHIESQNTSCGNIVPTELPFRHKAITSPEVPPVRCKKTQTEVKALYLSSDLRCSALYRGPSVLGRNWCVRLAVCMESRQWGGGGVCDGDVAGCFDCFNCCISDSLSLIQSSNQSSILLPLNDLSTL